MLKAVCARSSRLPELSRGLRRFKWHPTFRGVDGDRELQGLQPEHHARSCQDLKNQLECHIFGLEIAISRQNHGEEP